MSTVSNDKLFRKINTLYLVVHGVGRVPVSDREIPANSENIRDIGENGLSKQSAIAP
jgi:hypothetical protein